MFNNNDKYLYHYTSTRNALDYILANETLKLGSFNYVNDPKEAKIWPFKFICTSPKSKEIFSTDIFEEVHNHIMNRSFIVCFKQDDPSMNNESENNFKRGYSDSRMWSHYADNHEGVCLVFNKEKLNKAIRITFKDDIVFNESIKYSDDGESLYENRKLDPYLIFYEKLIAEGLDPYLKNHILQFNKDLYFTKQSCWKDEKEYRWVVYSSSQSKEIYVSIKDSLEAIIIGNDFKIEHFEKVAIHAKELGIKLYKLFNRGWAQHLFECMLTEPQPENVISLDGITFSTLIPCDRIFTQACDFDGKRRTIVIEAGTGAVIVYE